MLALAVSRLIKHIFRVNETYQEEWIFPTWDYHICSVFFLPAVLTFLFQTLKFYAIKDVAQISSSLVGQRITATVCRITART